MGGDDLVAEAPACFGGEIVSPYVEQGLVLLPSAQATGEGRLVQANRVASGTA